MSHAAAVGIPLERPEEYPIPTGAHWTLQGPDGMWVIRWYEATKTVQARRFDHGTSDGFSAEAADLPAARREVLRIAGLIADGKTGEGARTPDAPLECRVHGTVSDDHFPCRVPGESADQYQNRVLGYWRDV